MTPLRPLFRTLRSVVARAAGAALALAPAFEPGFVAVGRAVTARSHLGGTLYWAIHQDLVRRLRSTGRCLRRVRFRGFDLMLDVTDHSAYLWYFHGQEYEPSVTGAIIERLKPGDAFVDIGANVGFFSVIAATLVGPSGHVVAFEPDPTALPRLRALLKANALDERVHVVAGAAGASNGRATLHMTADSVLSTLDPAQAPLGGEYAFTRSVDVDVYSLDDWIQARGDFRSRLRVVKIDVEGTEADVLRGATTVLSTDPRPLVICETTQGSAADHLMSRLGYRAATIAEQRGDTSTVIYEPVDATRG